MSGFRGFVDISASADFLAPGSIEINRYQTEILDRVRRRFALGQRINQTPATGQPTRWFEQLAIPVGGWTNPRQISGQASQPQRAERVASLKALYGGINFGIFDVEVTQQQGQYSYLESKDLTDTIDGVLKGHDLGLWAGNDTSLLAPTTNQYYGIQGQIANAMQPTNGPSNLVTIAATGSLVDAVKLKVAQMAARQDFEVRPSAIYSNPLGLNLFDQEAKQFQLYYNKVEILPGVIVDGIPTQVGIIPLVPDAGLTLLDVNGNPNGTTPGTLNNYQFYILSEDLIEYHWLTNPLPRVFQMGLQQNLAAQYSVIKFGAVVVKGAGYAHARLTTQRP